MTCMFYDAHIYDISCIMDTCIMDIFIMDIYIMDTSAWIARPERPKGVKDEVKQARRAQSRPEGPPARSRAPEGP